MLEMPTISGFPTKCCIINKLYIPSSKTKHNHTQSKLTTTKKSPNTTRQIHIYIRPNGAALRNRKIVSVYYEFVIGLYTTRPA